MDLNAEIPKNHSKTFRRKKVLTLPDLKTLLNCSAITVQRRLKAWQAIKSYNHNGRYYRSSTLALPIFGFSR